MLVITTVTILPTGPWFWPQQKAGTWCPLRAHAIVLVLRIILSGVLYCEGPLTAMLSLGPRGPISLARHPIVVFLCPCPSLGLSSACIPLILLLLVVCALDVMALRKWLRMANVRKTPFEKTVERRVARGVPTPSVLCVPL